MEGTGKARKFYAFDAWTVGTGAVTDAAGAVIAALCYYLEWTVTPFLAYTTVSFVLSIPSSSFVVRQGGGRTVPGTAALTVKVDRGAGKVLFVAMWLFLICGSSYRLVSGTGVMLLSGGSGWGRRGVFF